MHIHPVDIAILLSTFFAGILQKIFKDAIADKISACLKWLFVHTEREAIYYMHYRDKRMKNRLHFEKDPKECRDGHCKQI